MVDHETLQAVITHRYDVLARYLRSARKAAGEEIARLTADARERRLLRHWVIRGEGVVASRRVSPDLRARLTLMIANNETLRKLQSLRGELEGVWGRSTATQEQLVKQLQDWVARAEASGIQQIAEFSASLRRYAV